MSDSAINVETAAGCRRIRRLFPGVLVFLGCVVLLSSLLLSEARAVTVSQCKDAWPGSSAAQSCRWSHATIYNNKCRVRAWCLNSWGGTNFADVMVPLDRVDDLSNCNGRLRDGSC